MVRRTSPIVLLGTLAGGVVLGVALGRSGPHLAAQQATSTTRGEVSPAVSKPVAVRAESARAGSETELYEKLARQYEQFEHVNRTFELVAQAVSPAVVHIVAQKTGRTGETAHVRRYEETGSGVIVRSERGKELYVLTNNHVIEGARPEKINIALHDGLVVHPVRVWLDTKADIALLSLGRNDLPAARLGDSDAVAVGSWVLALGSPFGLTHSVSQGIISARGRHMDELEDVENQDFLQTDAAINPGNSGGPLVNMKGEVIGINNSIASSGGGNEGVGFSIPINLARWIMNQLLANGRVSRGALGIHLHPEFPTEDALAMGLDRPRGAWVKDVNRSSPAAEGGLHDGDVILRFRGVDVHDLNHLINIVSMAPIGESVDLVVLRDHKQLGLTVKVGERDLANGPPGPTPEWPQQKGLIRRPERPLVTSMHALGMELMTLADGVTQRLGLPENERGALVARVAPESPLVTVLRQNDVIVTVDGRPVQTAEEAVAALNVSGGQGKRIMEFDRLVRGSIERRSVRLP